VTSEGQAQTVKDAAQDVAEDLAQGAAEGLLGAAKVGGVKALI